MPIIFICAFLEEIIYFIWLINNSTILILLDVRDFDDALLFVCTSGINTFSILNKNTLICNYGFCITLEY